MSSVFRIFGKSGDFRYLSLLGAACGNRSNRSERYVSILSRGLRTIKAAASFVRSTNSIPFRGPSTLTLEANASAVVQSGATIVTLL